MKEIIFIVLLSFVMVSCGLKKPLTLDKPEDNLSLGTDII